MSIQETKLTEIADAIRYKEGSTAPIVANDFAPRIRALPTGGLPADMRKIALSLKDPAGGSVIGGGLVQDGMTVQVEAMPNENWVFNGWFENDVKVSSAPQYLFPITTDRNLIADMMYNPYVLGKDWWLTGDVLPVSASWQDITFGGGKFWAIAYGGRYGAYSEDGFTWTQFDTGSAKNYTSITYIEGTGQLLLTVASSQYGYTSSNGGSSWSATTLPASRNWRDAANGGGTTVVVASGNNSIAYRDDGETSWHSATIPGSNYTWFKVEYHDGIFAAVSQQNAQIAYSTDKGRTWKTTSIFSGNYYGGALAGGNGIFSSVTRQGTAQSAILNSSGVVTRGTRPAGGQYYDMAFGNGVFVTVPYGTTTPNYFLYSTDGLVWNTTQNPYPANWFCVAFGHDTFIALAYNQKRLAYSRAAGPIT